MTNYGDKYEKTISVRLTEEQFIKLSQLAFLFDCSESQYIRTLLDSINLNMSEGDQNENVKTDSDD